MTRNNVHPVPAPILPSLCPPRPPDQAETLRSLAESLGEPSVPESYLGHTFTVYRRLNGMFAATITGPDGVVWPTEVAFCQLVNARLDARRAIERRIEDQHREAQALGTADGLCG